MMQRLFVILILAVLVGGCGDSSTVVIDPDPDPVTLFEGLTFGSAADFDLVTWNLKYFPANDDLPAQSVAYVADAIRALDPDVVALQEIDDAATFNALLAELDGWSGYRANRYLPLAYLWKPATVTVTVGPREIFTGEGYAFPRPPLVLECTFAGRDLIVVNNHFKCCGDNVIVDGDNDDDEYRRVMACEMLEEWIRTEHPDDAVILLGDLNDLLTDAVGANVFNVFLDAPDDYRFLDYAIATGSSANWSWKYSSHLDHVLVSNELFGFAAAAGSEIRTLHMDTYLAHGWNEYETNLSDHLPVGLKLPLSP